MSKTLKQVAILNGPNLNMLGKREPELYGAHTLDQINGELAQKAGPLGLELVFFQSNHEGELVEKIHALFESKINGIIINPGAFTHTSVAIRDALLYTNGKPFVINPCFPILPWVRYAGSATSDIPWH
jgi:3-dehydroquinate dehydratase-2